jgi:hypothetical protein
LDSVTDRVAPPPVDRVERWFSDPRIKAVLAGKASRGSAATAIWRLAMADRPWFTDRSWPPGVVHGNHTRKVRRRKVVDSFRGDYSLIAKALSWRQSHNIAADQDVS